MKKIYKKTIEKNTVLSLMKHDQDMLYTAEKDNNTDVWKYNLLLFFFIILNVFATTSLRWKDTPWVGNIPTLQ